jgi:hypothetical protein
MTSANSALQKQLAFVFFILLKTKACKTHKAYKFDSFSHVRTQVGKLRQSARGPFTRVAFFDMLSNDYTGREVRTRSRLRPLGGAKYSVAIALVLCPA